jgi:hypothetical protein
VRLIHEHLAAEGARVEESRMLVDRETGEEREVDLTLTTEVAGHEIVLAVEATERKRPADAKWVEAEIAKHRTLPTDKLILVSDSGFTRGGKAKADATGGKVVALTPEEIDAEPERAIVSRLGIVLAKTIKVMPPDELTILVRKPDGDLGQAAIEQGYDAGIFNPDGEQISTVRDEFRKRIEAVANQLPDELEISDQPQTIDGTFQVALHGWTRTADGSASEVGHYLEMTVADGEEEFMPVVELLASVQMQIEIVHVSLSHMRLGAAATSFGKASLADGDGLVVVTEDDDCNVRASLRAADGLLANLSLDESLKFPLQASG